MNEQIETQGLSVQRSERTVLSDIDLRVPAGAFVTIVGKSGAGKSTLLHALAGHLPYTGAVRIPENIGMVFQQYALFPWMTVEQNIAFGLRLDHAEKSLWIQECLQMAGLEEKAHVYPASLSGGQQQRVAIARAIAHKPEVLLMDEPFGSLDAYTREQMQRWLAAVRRTHEMTILLVTHSIEEALVLADRIIVLRDGKIADQFSDFRSSLQSMQAKFSSQFLQMRRLITDALS